MIAMDHDMDNDVQRAEQSTPTGQSSKVGRQVDLPFELFESKSSLFTFSFVSLLFSAGGVLMILYPRRPHDELFGFLDVFIFGVLGLLVLLPRLIASGRPIAILTSEGMICPSIFEGVLSWNAVRSGELISFGRSSQSFLRVTLYPGAGAGLNWKGLLGWMLARRGSSAPTLFQLAVGSRSKDTERFYEILKANIDAAKAARPAESNFRQLDAQDADIAVNAITQDKLDETTATFPSVTLALTGLLAVIFVAEVVASGGNDGKAWAPSIQTLVQFGGIAKAAVSQGQWWRVFSAPLLHASIAHLLFNCTALWIVGLRFERYIGSSWFAFVFAGSAVTGSVMSLAINPSNVVGVGASGGIVGLFAATALASRHFPPGRMRTVMVMTAAQTLMPALIPFLSNAGAGRIDYAAHLGGAIGGATFGLSLLPLWPQALTRPRYGRAVAFGAGLCALIGIGAVIFGVISKEIPAQAPPPANTFDSRLFAEIYKQTPENNTIGAGEVQVTFHVTSQGKSTK